MKSRNVSGYNPDLLIGIMMMSFGLMMMSLGLELLIGAMAQNPLFPTTGKGLVLN